MEHKLVVNFNSFDSDDETLEIIVKISSADIIKSVLKSLGKTIAKEYSDVNLTVITDQLLNKTSSSTIEKVTPTEDEYTDALMNENVNLNGYGSVYNLITLRSSVIKFYHYIYNHLFILNSNTSKISNTSVRRVANSSKKKKSSVIVDDIDDAFGKSNLRTPMMKKYTSSHKQKNINDWNSKDFLEYIMIQYKTYYGHDMFPKNGDPRKTIGYANVGIKNILVPIFKELKLDNSELKKYIDWLFGIKAIKLDYPIGVGFITSHKVINNWLYDKNKMENKKLPKIKM